MADLGAIGEDVSGRSAILLDVVAANLVMTAMQVPSDPGLSYEAAKTLSGTVRDSSNVLVARTVRAYRRDTGVFLGFSNSSAVDGTFSFTVPYAGEVQVVCLDDTAGSTENDLVHRVTFPVPTDSSFANVSLLMHMEGSSLVDSSSNAHALTASGATLDSGWSAYGAKSLLIATSSGNQNRVTAPHHTSFDFGAGEFSLEFRLRISTLPGTSMIVLTKADSTGLYPFQVYVTASNTLVFRGFDAASNLFTRETAALSASTDYWVQCRRRHSGGNAYMEIGINGVQADTAPGVAVWASGTAMYSNTGALVIGNFNSGAQLPLQGRVDELRITKGVARAFAMPSAALPDA